METCDPIGTPMEIKDKLDLDTNGTLGTVNMGLWYTKDFSFKLNGFSDADYAGCRDSFKSTSGGTQFLGEKLVGWSSKKQDCTALSIVEAEYVSLSACCVHVLWMRTQLMDYGFHFNKIPIYCDSKLAIAISYNPIQHSRTKHIAVRYHFIKKHVENGTIELYFVKTDYQLADLFTKALPVDRFNYLVCRLGMRSLSLQKLERLAKSHQNRRDLPRDTLLDRIEVLRKQVRIDDDDVVSFLAWIQVKDANRDGEDQVCVYEIEGYSDSYMMFCEASKIGKWLRLEARNRFLRVYDALSNLLSALRILLDRDQAFPTYSPRER
ncbi:hypothetical protein Tco_1163443 [Tanacetum coccineum]